MLWTWFLTVVSSMWSCDAISRFESPSATSSRTPASLAVRRSTGTGRSAASACTRLIRNVAIQGAHAISSRATLSIVVPSSAIDCSRVTYPSTPASASAITSSGRFGAESTTTRASEPMTAVSGPTRRCRRRDRRPRRPRCLPAHTRPLLPGRAAKSVTRRQRFARAARRVPRGGAGRRSRSRRGSGPRDDRPSCSRVDTTSAAGLDRDSRPPVPNSAVIGPPVPLPKVAACSSVRRRRCVGNRPRAPNGTKRNGAPRCRSGVSIAAAGRPRKCRAIPRRIPRARSGQFRAGDDDFAISASRPSPRLDRK